MHMELELKLRIVLEEPPRGVDFGLQLGKGADYQTIQKQQRSKGKDLSFNCSVSVKDNRADGLPNFLGPLAQGPPTGRFVYIDIGQYAGQKDTGWSRRIKVPLNRIDWKTIKKAANDPGTVLEARLPGTGRDGGPTCGTVRSAQGWKLIRG
jgi:hypothetical protein